MVVELTKKHSPQAIIIPILILSDKIIISFSCGDQTMWIVFIIIRNLDAKTQQFQKRPGTLLLDFILIIYELSKDTNNKNKNLNIKINYLALKTILQYSYPSFLSIDLKKMRC